jgi:hypothetical protein
VVPVRVRGHGSGLLGRKEQPRQPLAWTTRNADAREKRFGSTLDKGKILLVAETPGDIPTTRNHRWYAPTPAKFLLAVLVMQGILFLSAHYRWFWFNERKGYTVLITVGATAVALLFLVAAVLLSRFFKSKAQFSLATLMLAVPVVGFPCAWLGKEINLAQRQQMDARSIHKHWGGQVFYYGKPWRRYAVFLEDSRKSTLLERALGRHFFQEAESITIRGADDDDLKTIARFPRVQAIDAGGADMTDAGLKHLHAMTQLRRLQLSAGQITDQGVKDLQEALPQCKIEVTD